MRTRIKMCGTTLLEDALKASEEGVDAVGFIFVHKSPRYITPEQAKKISVKIPPFVNKVGVFVNSSQENIEEIVRYAGLTAIQLHGDESPLYCQEISERLPSCFLLKALRVSERSDAAEFARYENSVSGFLLDTYVKGVAGGTGQTFDWSLVAKLGIQKPFLLAGGLTPENISVALETLAPYGIDINSGIEISPGRKDHRRLSELMQLVRDYHLAEGLSGRG